MTCTFESVTTNGLSVTRNLVFRDGDKCARVHVAHRGGCLYCSVIDLVDSSDARQKSIGSTNGFANDKLGTTNAYLSELWCKHLA